MEKIVTMAQGAGGKLMSEFIKEHILSNLTPANKTGDIDLPLEALDDSAVIDQIALTTDSYTVSPLFFPGGDIGRLAAAGTINDLAVIGARPVAMTCSFIIEEGFRMNLFDRICRNLSETAKEVSLPIITGDTKVVERGAINELMINTTAIGYRSEILDRNLSEARRALDKNWLVDSNLESGDQIILSGNLADHGAALLSKRYGVQSLIKSDVAPIYGIVQEALKVGGVVAAKDPTRGGLSNLLNEWSEKSKIGIFVQEQAIPISEGSRAICEMLGIDPLTIGNEGKAVLGVVKEKAGDVLKAIRRHPLGKNASIIGEISGEIKGVVMETSVGTKRIVESPLGDPIPRIC
ncbi:MAG TPA: hydrogenase expression/formation protein HypE [Thermoplasmata archaeon]|nr:hydrogenase expression/formation protein HypE [Thermoplasmata archaeon]